MKHDNKDRIICVSESDKHKFYYQPVGTRARLWLFDTKNFSGSVFAFFRKYGRCSINHTRKYDYHYMFLYFSRKGFNLYE